MFSLIKDLFWAWVRVKCLRKMVRETTFHDDPDQLTLF